MSRTPVGGGLTPLQRYNRCILQHPPSSRLGCNILPWYKATSVRVQTKDLTHYRLFSKYIFFLVNIFSLRAFNTPFILKKINVSFIVYFCLDKYSFRLGTFLTQLIFPRKSTFYLFFISVLVKTALNSHQNLLNLPQ